MKKQLKCYERPVLEALEVSKGLSLLTNFSLEAVVDDYNHGLDIVNDTEL